MADNKKYYYLKLKEGFFESDEMLLLESQKDGHLYSNILLKLYLRSLKNGGKLMFNDRIPYNAEILSTVVRHNVATVEKALYLFKELGLVEILDNGAIYMMDIQNFIGQSSTEADRVRGYRNRIEAEKQKLLSGSNVQMYNKCTPEIEIEKEIESEIEKEEKKAPRTPAKHIHGEHKKVRLTDDELNKLKSEYSNSDELIQYLDEYKAMTGKVYKSDYLAIKKWVVNAVEEKRRKQQLYRKNQRVVPLPKYMTEQAEEKREASAEEKAETLKEMYKAQMMFEQYDLAEQSAKEYYKLTGHDIKDVVGDVKLFEE